MWPAEASPMVPPHNYEAEQALLGAMLLNNRCYEKVAEFLRPEHFAEPTHGRIYAVAAKMIERGQLANPVTLTDHFKADEQLAEIGGTLYLAQLANAVVSIMNAGDYGRLILDLHLRRELIAMGEELVARAYDMTDLDVSAGRIREEHEAALFKLEADGDQRGGFVSMGEAAAQALREIEAAYKTPGEVRGTPSGLRDLDKRLGGMKGGDLIILGGRPAMGKTSLCTTIACHAAQATGKPVAFFELEMSAGQLGHRVLCARAGIDAEKARLGYLPDDPGIWERLTEAQRELEQIGVKIDPTPALSVSSVRTRARRLAARTGLSLIIVDHIGLQAPLDPRASKVHQIEQITNGLKALGKDLDVPVLALCQLSRAVEAREDKRPQLADLRDSGAVEQDADVVMFVYRDSYYIERAEPKRRPDEDNAKFEKRWGQWAMQRAAATGKAEIIISKNRHGRTGTVTLAFDDSRTWFSDLAHGEGE